MSTFLATQNQRNQTHFEVLEIDLPVITGACTIGGAGGTGTPLTCDQAWTGEYKTYYFTNVNAPLLPSVNGEPIYKCITNITNTGTELTPGDGLAKRSSLNITFIEINNQDPNNTAPGVTATVKKQGEYFQKLSERQIIENKNVRLKAYRVEADGSVDLANGAQTENFLASSFTRTSSGWSLSCKDVLSLVNLDEKTWPISQGGHLRLDINNSTASIPVDSGTDYSTTLAVRIGDELMRVTSVTNNLTLTATLNVNTRGASIVAPNSGVILSQTNTSDHDAGDEVFICHMSDNETIHSLLAKILTDCDFDAALIPIAEWAAEVAEWHASDLINTLHTESEDARDSINRVLNGFFMDLWFSTTENKARLSAISVHKESTLLLTEGREIIAHSVKKSAKELLRATRALVLYGKKNLTDSGGIGKYKKSSIFKDDSLIGEALHSEHKDKQFDDNFLLDGNSAQLLTQRYVGRYKRMPFERTFKADEKNLRFKVGDVVDLQTESDKTIFGLPSTVRSQILRINTKYTTAGRVYDIKTLSYQAAFDSGSEILINSPMTSVNLHILAGAPSAAIDLVFVFDGTYSAGDIAIRAGNFAAGSTLNIIMINGFDGQANGGHGGNGESISWEGSLITEAPTNGANGGVVFQGSAGITINMYFSGDTSAVSTAYPVADGFIRAPSGGDGGFSHSGSGNTAVSGNGGDGGDGRTPGEYGAAGFAEAGLLTKGTDGINGQINGTGSGWGVNGSANGAVAGLMGSGIVDNGATINLFGHDAARYINGSGDH